MQPKQPTAHMRLRLLSDKAKRKKCTMVHMSTKMHPRRRRAPRVSLALQQCLGRPAVEAHREDCAARSCCCWGCCFWSLRPTALWQAHVSAVLESAGPPVRMEELAGPGANSMAVCAIGEVLAGAIRSVMLW